MLKKIGRLFRIETRFEAWLVIYAIALGAVERGQYYLGEYPGASGWILAAACTGVVFVAGAKLLDSVRPAAALAVSGSPRGQTVNRSRSKARRSRPGSESRLWRRTGSLPTTPPLGRREGSPGDRTRSPDR